MKRLSIVLTCLSCIGATAQTERSAPPGPNITIPSAPPLPTTRPQGIQSPAAQQGQSVISGTNQVTPTNQVSVVPLESGLIHGPSGATNLTAGGTNSVQGTGTVADGSITTGYVLSNGVVVGTSVTNVGVNVTNINEASGAARPVNSGAVGLTPAQQNLGQRVMDAVGLQSGTGSQNDQMIMFVTGEGEVILRGTVSSEDQRKSIETQVQGVSGVNAVRNELQVTGATDAPQTQP